MKGLITQMFKAMKATSPPYMPASVWEDMDKTFSSYDLMGELVPIYQKYLTREDLAATLAFYHTDAGKHLLANQGAMSQESQADFRAIGQRLGEEVGARHADEIEAARKKYEQGIADKQNLNKLNLGGSIPPP